MDLTPQRRFVTPLAGERVEDLAARALPDEPLDSAVDKMVDALLKDATAEVA